MNSVTLDKGLKFQAHGVELIKKVKKSTIKFEKRSKKPNEQHLHLTRLKKNWLTMG
ncbi:hypothetical protein [Carnobacterium sp.]|uniref:hypothetical protein n=1 Tax=Carnobacterium sp. TaxID=48221 RepID=UPI00388F756E